MRYRNMSAEDVKQLATDPHVFAVCIRGLHHFTNEDTNISFVISGESGAGKTETTKHILGFFTTPADGSETKDEISTALMAGNPILEAMGNAMTLRNNNSSRFGRLIRLFMNAPRNEDEKNGIPLDVPIPHLLGGDVTPFLLEKSRITHA